MKKTASYQHIVNNQSFGHLKGIVFIFSTILLGIQPLAATTKKALPKTKTNEQNIIIQPNNSAQKPLSRAMSRDLSSNKDQHESKEDDNDLSQPTEPTQAARNLMVAQHLIQHASRILWQGAITPSDPKDNPNPYLIVTDDDKAYLFAQQPEAYSDQLHALQQTIHLPQNPWITLKQQTIHLAKNQTSPNTYTLQPKDQQQALHLLHALRYGSKHYYQLNEPHNIIPLPRLQPQLPEIDPSTWKQKNLRIARTHKLIQRSATLYYKGQNKTVTCVISQQANLHIFRYLKNDNNSGLKAKHICALQLQTHKLQRNAQRHFIFPITQAQEKEVYKKVFGKARQVGQEIKPEDHYIQLHIEAKYNKCLGLLHYLLQPTIEKPLKPNHHHLLQLSVQCPPLKTPAQTLYLYTSTFSNLTYQELTQASHRFFGSAVIKFTQAGSNLAQNTHNINWQTITQQPVQLGLAQPPKKPLTTQPIQKKQPKSTKTTTSEQPHKKRRIQQAIPTKEQQYPSLMKPTSPK